MFSGDATYADSATFESSLVINGSNPGITMYDNLETITYSNCEDESATNNNGAQVSGSCSASGPGVQGYAPSPVGAHGLTFTPPNP